MVSSIEPCTQLTQRALHGIKEQQHWWQVDVQPDLYMRIFTDLSNTSQEKMQPDFTAPFQSLQDGRQRCSEQA